METLDDGFLMKANPAFHDWPINVSVTMAYADGTRSPAWSRFDFEPADLVMSASGCSPTFVKNKLIAKDCGAGFSIEVLGFDARRELDTHIEARRNAKND
jgi:hypothetical protein